MNMCLPLSGFQQGCLSFCREAVWKVIGAGKSLNPRPFQHRRANNGNLVWVRLRNTVQRMQDRESGTRAIQKTAS